MPGKVNKVNLVRVAPAGTITTMSVKVEGGSPITLWSTPPVVTGGPAAWNITETPRPGRQPVSQATTQTLRTLKFEHRVASLETNVSVEAVLAPLRDAVEKGKRVQFFDGGMWVTGTWWWVKSLEVQEDLKAPDNSTSRATLSWDCVQATTMSKLALTKGDLKPRTMTYESNKDTSKPHQPWNDGDGAEAGPGAKPTIPDNTSAPTNPGGNTTDPSKPFMPR